MIIYIVLAGGLILFALKLATLSDRGLSQRYPARPPCRVPVVRDMSRSSIDRAGF